jgi:hypothetical protein
MLMNPALFRVVWRRAKDRCEYTQIPQQFDRTPFEIDHIVSGRHKGPTVAGNLCLSCFYRHSLKGSDISRLDAVTRKLTPLFNPRRHKWSRHFRWEGPYLRPITCSGDRGLMLVRSWWKSLWVIGPYE